jgi:hypothetical protein
MDGEKSLEESITNLKEDGGLHAGCNLQSNAAFRSGEEECPASSINTML